MITHFTWLWKLCKTERVKLQAFETFLHILHTMHVKAFNVVIKMAGA